jgi:hypothetical protein
MAPTTCALWITRVEGPFSEVRGGGGLLVVKAIDSEQEVGIS